MPKRRWTPTKLVSTAPCSGNVVPETAGHGDYAAGGAIESKREVRGYGPLSAPETVPR